ncbi:putative transposase [Desulfovibrio intestinalis]|uniref:Putative transposase n=1 Tax=Desulfovibrio intestinalis TaxID=58621 RepID=A0A7W8FD39_9BACT|nr:putative transposase [Desulfovibrio intestinalis]
MVDSSHAQLSMVRQCALLKIARSGLYYVPKGESALTLALMQEIDRAFTEWPFLGVRQMRDYLVLLGYGVGRKRVRRLMRLMGLMAVYQKPKNSIPHPEHTRYPYLLRRLSITRPNQVWCADITYIPMRKRFLYLVAVMDWHSKKVLSWKLSNTMDADFCVAALEEALAKHGKPDIFNTDQGSQFTSFAFTNVLQENGIRISMDGRGRWLDNVFIERLWRSLKYECVYLHAFETGSEARAGIGRWIDFYNRLRPHSRLGGLPPDTYYEQGLVKAA